MQGAAKAFATQQGALVQLCADIGQALAPPGQQVRRRGLAGGQLREAHTVHPGIGVQIHHVHTGHIAGLDHSSRAFGAVKTGQQQTPWLVGHVVAQQVFFFIARIMGVADQYFKALGPQYLMDSFQGFDKQQVGQ